MSNDVRSQLDRAWREPDADDLMREATLLRHAPDVTVELGLDGRVRYISPAVEAILGRPCSVYLGRSFIDFIVPEDREAMLASHQKLVANGDDPRTRFRVLRQDGARVTFESTASVFVDRDGERRIVAIARDMTEEFAERSIERRREHDYRALVESGSRPAAIVTPRGEIVFSNQQFKATFGSQPALTEVYRRLESTTQQQIATSWFDSNRPDRDAPGSCDFEYEGRDGRPAWFSASWNAFQGEDGERRIAVVYEDISRRKRVELALRDIAQGITSERPESLRAMVAQIAEALDFDRLVLGTLKEEGANRLAVSVAWQDGRFLDVDEIELDELPDAAVARGEDCLFASELARLVPCVSDRIGADIESYAGLPLRRADGRVIGLLGGYGRRSIRDPDLVRSLLSAFATQAASAIDRVLADQEIRTNQARFEAIASQANDLLIEVDEARRITFASTASLPVLGYPPADLLGRDLRQLAHPEDAPVNDATAAQLAAGAQQIFTNSRIRHADGSWRWLDARANAYTASDGSQRLLIIARDVTERRYHELGQALLYRVVERSADLVFVCEPDLTLLFANIAARRRIGAPPEAGRRDLASGSFADALPSAEAERLRREILPELLPDAPWSGELVLAGHEPGSTIQTEASLFLFSDEDQQDRTYLAITLRDVEARRRAEEALRESELRLSQAQKMEAVGRLAGGIAHDFNNLLTAIIGYSDLLLDEIGADHVASRDAHEILRAAERAGGLTRQLLAFSRRQVLQPEAIDLNAVVSDIDRMMRRLIGEDIELITHQAADLRPILADPGQIETVIVNLVVNGRDAMPEGGRLEIRTANQHETIARATDSGLLEAGDYVVLTIADDGVGMDEATRSQIFEPFFTTKEAHHGTGLGLASVYGIVSQSGGQIEVESEPGAGTQLHVYLPAGQHSETSARPVEESARPGGNETILLVEDADPVRRLIQRTLEKNGYEVLPAESATAALRYCSRHDGPIDLLLSDVVLPRTPGPEIARRARELRPEIQVLFMSGFSDETLSEHGLEIERDALLEKPFTPLAILERLRDALDLPGETLTPRP